MDASVIFPLLVVLGCILIISVINYLDKDSKKLKQKDKSGEGNGCVSVVFIIALILVVVGLIVVNLQQCSHETQYHLQDRNIEEPIHRD